MHASGGFFDKSNRYKKVTTQAVYLISQLLLSLQAIKSDYFEGCALSQ